MKASDQVREYLADSIFPVTTHFDGVARDLGLSSTALRRHLKREGTSFRELYDDEILKRLKKMHAKGMKPTRMAEALGYSSLQSMQRWVAAKAPELRKAA